MRRYCGCWIATEGLGESIEDLDLAIQEGLGELARFSLIKNVSPQKPFRCIVYSKLSTGCADQRGMRALARVGRPAIQRVCAGAAR
jgi:hypothetical protein